MSRVKISFYLSCFFWILLASGLGYALFPDANPWQQDYEQILIFSQNQANDLPVRQDRKHVSKVYIQEKGEIRYQYTVEAEESSIAFKSKYGEEATTEELKNIRANWEEIGGDQPLGRLIAKAGSVIPARQSVALNQIRFQKDHQSPILEGLESVQAGNAEFNGTRLYLTDQVEAIFESMFVRAQQAIFYLSKSSRKLDIEKIELRGNVEILSKDAKLNFSCQAEGIDWIVDKQTLITHGFSKFKKEERIFSAKQPVIAQLNRTGQGMNVKNIYTHGYARLEEGPTVLMCQGKTVLDQVSRLLKMEADAQEHVYCKDKLASIQGDRLEAWFVEEKSNLVISKMIFQGHIAMASELHPETRSALADKVEYQPSSKLWIFSAQPPKKVLYQDKLNKMTMNAPLIYVQEIEGQEKPNVKALGDVRFIFAGQELQKLEQEWYPSSRKNHD